jgi:SecD/SecF fusion protein
MPSPTARPWPRRRAPAASALAGTRMRRYVLILLALLGAMVAVGVLSLFRSPTLGLDLQGGLAVVLQAEAPKGEEVDKAGMDRAKEIMDSRVNKLGVSESEVRIQGSDQMIVELPGVHDAARAAQVVGTTAQLEFYKLEDDVAGPSKGTPENPVVPNDSVLPLLTPEDRIEPGTEPSEWYLFSSTDKQLAGPADTKEQLLDDFGREPPKGSTFYVVPEDRVVLTCGEDQRSCPGVNGAPTQTWYYLFEYQPDNADEPIPELTGNDLSLRGTQQDFDGGQPIVTLEFTGSGGDKFHQITRELAQRGRQVAAQLGIRGGASRDERQFALQRFAIVLDREIRSYPTIDYVENPDGIAGGRAQISGLEGVGEAKDLALVLQTGALPYTFTQLERTDISATLGEDSLHQALLAGIGGLLAVALFLLLVYRFLGVVALFGLAIYGVFLYGTILFFNVTLTLPSFAGLILTIGVAADANIVIFERIKEEVRSGKSMRASIATGYRKGFHTIVDANVVTMITAAIIFLIGSGGVKGFALMLLLGTAISMVTAVLATRAILGILANFRWFENPVFMGARGREIPRWQRIDFIGRRRVWAAISATVVLVCLGSLVVQGLNLGIDFRGGSQISFETSQAIPVETVRREAGQLGYGNAVIQGRGEATDGGYTAFQMRTGSLTTDQQNRLTQQLERELQAESIGVKNVSASFSEQILRGAIIAIVISLALIALYIAIRFEPMFGVPVLVALLHDVLIAVGVYSISGREVTTATVAAVLTILGYSVYDTIIIFDRVRENLGLMRKSSIAAITNQSLWEVLPRSIATTISTLLPVTALYFFGGETLKDFAFALMVGITAGAYSSIFVAAPLLAWLKEREPEFERRKGAGHVEKAETLTAAPEPVTVPVAEEVPAPVAAPEPDGGDGAKAADAAAARREARRKRRRARPHGRSR